MSLFRFRLQGAPGTSWGGLTVRRGLWHWVKGEVGGWVWPRGFKDGRQVMRNVFTVSLEQHETNQGEQEATCGWVVDGDLLSGEGCQLTSLGSRRKSLSLPSDLNLWNWCIDLELRRENRLCKTGSQRQLGQKWAFTLGWQGTVAWDLLRGGELVVSISIQAYWHRRHVASQRPW